VDIFVHPCRLPRQGRGTVTYLKYREEMTMVFDFKKEYKQLYQPKCSPELVTVPEAHYLAVRGQGDPNAAEGAYQSAIQILYSIAYTIKMSKRGDHPIEGYFDFVVPPLEGFWEDFDYQDKSVARWISVLRLPDFVTQEVFAWAVADASRKKKLDCSRAELLTVDEGLCVQILHLGPYDDEPATVARMDAFLEDNGYENDFSTRLHHEIYLSNSEKVPPEKWKTVIRHPIRKKL